LVLVENCTDCSTDDDSLELQMQHPKTGVPVRSIKHKLRTHVAVFYGVRATTSRAT
jgi:hypothetical protein